MSTRITAVITLAAALSFSAGCTMFGLSSNRPSSIKSIAIHKQNADSGHDFPPAFAIPTYRPIPTQIQGLTRPVEMKLDGVWRFSPERPPHFQTAAMQGPCWSDFRVPGQWEQQGFILPDDTVAVLGTDFQVPASFRSKRIFLRFDAVHGGTEYWLNGKKLGETEYYWTPVEFEITKVVKFGRVNRLRLTQTRNVFSEAIQFHGYAGDPHETGILRSVRLFALPAVHISTLHIDTDLDEHYRDAELRLGIELDNPGPEPARNLRLRLSLTAPSGCTIKLPVSIFNLRTVPKGRSSVQLSSPVSSPARWNAEKPRLYKLTVELFEKNLCLEGIERHVGFRQVEVRNQRILINGRPVKLAGACRHEMDPVSYRADTGHRGKQDVLLLKAANLNFTRSVHYPPTKEFLDACDRYGFYVVVEAPFMWTRFVPGEDDPNYVKQFLDPTAAAVEYNRNHPSVIMWSLGNECGFEEIPRQGRSTENRLPKNYLSTHKLIKQMDRTRLTIFENEWNRDGATCDVACLHYPPMPFDKSRFIQNENRPVLLDELFLVFPWNEDLINHDPGSLEQWAMGNNIHWYIHDRVMTPAQQKWRNDHQQPAHGQNHPDSQWNYIFGSEKLAGANIWQALGHLGLVDLWRRPQPAWWTAKRMFAPVYIPTRCVDYQEGQRQIRIPIENRYSFTRLNEIKLYWEVADRTGQIHCNLPPMSDGHITVNLPEAVEQGDMLIIRAVDAAGQLINAHGVRLGKYRPPAVPEPTAGCPNFTEDSNSIIVRGEGFAFTVDKASGRITALQGRNRVALLELPSLYVVTGGGWNLWKPTGVAYRQLPNVQSRRIDSVTVQEKADSLILNVVENYEKFTGSLDLTIDRRGLCNARFDYRYEGQPLMVRELGLRFLMDRRCQKLRWKRHSEWDIYPCDHIGRARGTAWAQRSQQWPQQQIAQCKHQRLWHIYPVIAKDNPAQRPFGQPAWPWSLDTGEHGTNDFRSSKFHIYRASLTAPDGSGIRAWAKADANIRASLEAGAAALHFWQPGEPREVKTGDKLAGEFMVSLMQINGQ